MPIVVMPPPPPPPTARPYNSFSLACQCPQPPRRDFQRIWEVPLRRGKKERLSGALLMQSQTMTCKHSIDGQRSLIHKEISPILLPLEHLTALGRFNAQQSFGDDIKYSVCDFSSSFTS